jgi:predicted ATP-dependent serine protease
MTQIYVCGACGKQLTKADADAGPFCPYCLVPDIRLEDEPDPAPRRGSTAFVTSLAEAEDPVTLPCEAPLVACLGGVQRGALIVVSGEPGEGKSTECARVAVALGEPPAYLDREMTAKRCKVVLRDAGASAAFIRRTRRIVGEQWSHAVELAHGRSIWILDSVSEWVGQEDEKDLADALVQATESGVIVFAIQQWTRQGRARGTLQVEHRGDVTIDLVTKERPKFHVRKTRWGEKGFYDRPRLSRST